MTMEYLRIPLEFRSENTADFGYSLFFGCRCSSTENFFKVLVDNFRIFGVGKQFRLQNLRPVHVFIEELYR